MKLAILGAGSIGCYLAGQLLAQGHQVVLIGRATLANQIAEFGLTSASLDGDVINIGAQQISFVEHLSQAQQLIPDLDAILLTVQSKDTQAAARQINQQTSITTTIVSLQNGVANSAQLKQLLPQHQVIAAMVPFNVVHQGQGKFYRTTEGQLIFEHVAFGQQLALAFKQAGLNAATSNDIQAVLWGKLLMNLNNAINLLSGLPLKQQLANRYYRRVLALSIAEALKVLNKAGVQPAQVGKVPPRLLPYLLNLPNWLFLRLAQSMLKMDDNARSSMADDWTLGRTSEIAYLNGEIIKLAQRNKLASPVNQYLVSLVNQVFAGKLMPGIDSRQLYQKLFQLTSID